jgi:predicted ATPase
MLKTLAVENYRSLHSLVVPLAPLTVVTGANGVGKSNLYGALRLLVSAARGQAVSALAREGGLPNIMWAGPATVSRAMERGDVPVQGGPQKGPARVRLGFASDDFGYLIELGMPVPSNSAFDLDPEIKRECIWHGDAWRAASTLVDRKGPVVRRRQGRRWEVVSSDVAAHESLLEVAGDPATVPEVFRLREIMRQWRFYADFRTDADAPARRSIPATRTPILHHDGRDLAAALQTIIEVGDRAGLMEAIDDAFPGSELMVGSNGVGWLDASLKQPGLLRSLGCAEWSDGTLRYVLLVAALLTPRPPPLMILNEPETSLHPELIAPLARLIMSASARSQVWVISHSRELVRRLEHSDEIANHVLEKSLGRTVLAGQGKLDGPPWRWG